MILDGVTRDRVRFAALADYLAVAAVVSLPWSTSATSILVPLWAVAAAATIDGAAFRRIAMTPAALFPVALALLAVAGTLWSEAAWPERLDGIAPFLKFLIVPLALTHFSTSKRGETVLAAFFTSVAVLLAVSWLMVLFPRIPWPVRDAGAPFAGVPVRDYIIQSEEFALCGFILFERAIAAWNLSRMKALALAGFGLAFLANIVFVAAGRTAVVVCIALFGLLGLRHFKRRALAAFLAAGVALAAVAWTSSPYLRERVTHLVPELDGSITDIYASSAGLRMGFWKMSMKAVSEAPLFGHGTGSVHAVFARIAAADPAAPADADNPHNQVLATAIPLGLLGVVLLIAMWVVHFRMFLLPGPAAWIGLCVVAQNVVGSLFNSHLLDFAQGWLYVFGVGIAGGVMLRRQASDSLPRRDPRPASAPPAAAPAAKPVVQAGATS
jgi:O-antigen ligase